MTDTSLEGLGHRATPVGSARAITTSLAVAKQNLATAEEALEFGVAAYEENENPDFVSSAVVDLRGALRVLHQAIATEAENWARIERTRAESASKGGVTT